MTNKAKDELFSVFLVVGAGLLLLFLMFGPFILSSSHNDNRSPEEIREDTESYRQYQEEELERQYYQNRQDEYEAEQGNAEFKKLQDEAQEHRNEAYR